MSLAQLRSIDPGSFDLVSVDVFDTILLRHQGTEQGRFREVASVLADSLQAHGYAVDAATLLGVRRRVHRLSYRAVSMERPEGDASLARMIGTQIALLGLDSAAAPLFVAAELDVERRRLSPNRPLLHLLGALRDAGKAVIAVSDMYLSSSNLDYLLARIVGRSPIQRIYVSSDFGKTKRSGALFPHVWALENIPPARIVHCGDDEQADFVMARAAGCRAVLLRRSPWAKAMRQIAGVRALARH